MTAITDAIETLVRGAPLPMEDAAAAMDDIMSGSATPAQFGAFVAALRVKGETVGAVYEPDLPDDLEVTARTDSGVIMGARHKRHPVEGIQFHPESIMTKVGRDLLRNFLSTPPPQP